MFIRNLKIGRRLGLGFAVIIALSLTMAALAYFRLLALSDNIQATNGDRYPKTVLVHTVKDELNETARNMRNLLLLTDAAAVQKEYENIESNTRAISAALDKLDKSIASSEGRARFNAIAEVRLRFLKERDSFLQMAKAQTTSAALEQLVQRVRPVQLDYFAALDKLIEWQTHLMEESGAEAERVAASTRMIVVLLALGAAILSVVVGFFVSRSITRPLADAVGVARRVADGDLTSNIVVNSRDETGQLLQALKDMNASLLRIVGDVRNGTDTIATASTQIAVGNMDLSARTEQQAGALEETASSLEELAATVKQNADNARQANQMAQSASDIARKGGAVVSQVVGTMGSINDASRKIVDIISVIDGIAFQTNILALNAAVEAARAGEQGRGFAVVAGEVRNLAQRSASAAKEIKTLINDSVAQVDIGSTLVAQAGATMVEMVSSVQRVTDIMGEISSASHEQEAGIHQINQAVADMDAVTQQNAALVEEAAAAASSLQDQASQLAAAVGTFKLTAQHTFAAVPARARSSAPVAAPARPQPRRLAAGAGSDDWEQF
jgi:methyl-accepting chemotaxis protein